MTIVLALGPKLEAEVRAKALQMELRLSAFATVVFREYLGGLQKENPIKNNGVKPQSERQKVAYKAAAKEKHEFMLSQGPEGSLVYAEYLQARARGESWDIGTIRKRVAEVRETKVAYDIINNADDENRNPNRAKIGDVDLPKIKGSVRFDVRAMMEEG